MIKPFPLQPLIHLAQHQNDTATRQLGALNKRQQTTQQQLDTLLHYRREYQDRLQQATKEGIDPTNLRNFQQFINKLDEAISQQSKIVEQSKLSVQAGRDEYNLAQRKLKSFDTLQQRFNETQHKIEAKSEQKILDEHSGRVAAYKHLQDM